MASSWKLSHVLLLVGIVALAGCAGVVPGDPAPTDPGTANESPNAGVNGTLEVHYINVGQSVSTLVIGPDGETMLIDTGHYNDDGEYVLDYLQRHEITRLDHLVTSHNDADHIGGNAAVIEHYEENADGIGAVYDPGIAASTQTYKEYLDAIEAHDVTLYETREGDTIPFGEVNVDVLGPPDPYLENEARNENSIVLKLTHGETSFLLSGDAEDDQEAYLTDKYGAELQSTVLKAGHHGSASSSSEPFLSVVQPQAVVISSAYDSQYGHPHDEVLQRLDERSLKTYWTATHGNVVFVSDGTSVSVRTQRGASTDPETLRDSEPVVPGTTDNIVERTQLNSGGVNPVDTTDDIDADQAGSTTETLVVAEINADAEGDDRENLNDEYVVLKNTGDSSIDMSGWTIEDDVGQSYTVPDEFILNADETVTLRTGDGTDTDTELYWGSKSPIWNNDGDTVIVFDDNGNRILEESY